jgi:hypothetical protein
MRRSSPLALLLVACGGTEAPAPLPPDPIYEARPLVRPTGSADITLEQQGVALPVELQGQRLHVAALSGVGTLVGGEGGLYQLTTEGLELVDATPVVGLAAFEDRIVVAHATDLAVWHGTLEPSSINETLSGRTLSALYSDGADLWLGTDLGLDRIRAGRLERFMAMPSPRALGRFQGGQHLIVTEAGGRDLGAAGDHRRGGAAGLDVRVFALGRGARGRRSTLRSRGRGAPRTPSRARGPGPISSDRVDAYR